METRSIQAGPQQQESQSIYVRRGLALVLLALVAWGGIAALKGQKSPVPPPPLAAPPLRAPPPDYSSLVNQKTDEARQKTRLAYERFEKSLAQQINRYGPWFDYAARKSSEKVSKPMAMGAIVYYLAKDRALKTNETDAYLSNEIGPVLKPIVDGFARDVKTMTDTLEKDLRTISVQLAVDLASIGPGNASKPQRPTLRASTWHELDQALRNLGFNATGVAVGLGFDAYAVANSRAVGPAILKRVVRISSRVFAKQIARLAASPALSTIGGPIPIGSVLAAIGIAWTAYDINRMQNDFREDVRKSTKNKLEGIRNVMNKQAREFAARKVAEANRLHSRMGDQRNLALGSTGN